MLERVCAAASSTSPRSGARSVGRAAPPTARRVRCDRVDAVARQELAPAHHRERRVSGRPRHRASRPFAAGPMEASIRRCGPTRHGAVRRGPTRPYRAAVRPSPKSSRSSPATAQSTSPARLSTWPGGSVCTEAGHDARARDAVRAVQQPGRDRPRAVRLHATHPGLIAAEWFSPGHTAYLAPRGATWPGISRGRARRAPIAHACAVTVLRAMTVMRRPAFFAARRHARSSGISSAVFAAGVSGGTLTGPRCADRIPRSAFSPRPRRWRDLHRRRTRHRGLGHARAVLLKMGPGREWCGLGVLALALTVWVGGWPDEPTGLAPPASMASTGPG